MQDFIWPAAVITGIRVVSVVVAKLKQGEFYSLHTIANKAGGVAVIISVLAFLAAEVRFPVYVALCIAFLAALEELIIFLIVKNPDKNRQSVFSRNKGSA